jgi:hypothetical protein
VNEEALTHWGLSRQKQTNSNYYIELCRRGIPYVQEKEGSLIGLITSCVGTTFCNASLKGRKRERWKRREDEEADVSSYWRT